MSLRVRLTLLAAFVVATTAIVVSAIAYFLVDDRLRDDLDASLEGSAARIAEQPTPENVLVFLESPVPGPRFYYAVILPNGAIRQVEGQNIALSADRERLRDAAADGKAVFVDVDTAGESLRAVGFPSADGRIAVVARSLSEVNDTTDALRVALLIVAAVAVAVTALVALLFGRAMLRPVSRLTRAAEKVAETQDLSATIDIHRDDELGRLATSVNAMLAALEASRAQQQRLVSDAEHELRTPLTSVRTNIEMLARQPAMPDDERQRVVAALNLQVVELTQLVDDLVELARHPDARTERLEDVYLDAVVVAAVEQVRPRAADVALEILELESTLIRGRQRELERVVVNLLDNACKWSPPGSHVEIRVADGRVTIRDHGVGIDPSDLPYVFDRFYRAPSARSAPGSGLGLAIVRRIVDEHGGSIDLHPADGGGTIVTLLLPEARTEPDRLHAHQP
jgi:two-component system sensor histidine kinase MprB